MLVNRKSVFVTDGIWRKSLAVVRALARSGVKVAIGERTWMAPGLLSRYVSQRYIYPSLEKYPDQFLSWLEDTLKLNKFDVLITPEEETSLLAARHIDRLSSYIRIPLARFESLALARNKFNLLTHAQKIGVPCPMTLLVKKDEDIMGKAKGLSFPLVFKPIISTGGHGIRYVFKEDLLQENYREMSKKYDSFLLQEYIPGSDYFGVSVIFNDRHKMRSAFVHKKIRQYPVSGGASTYAVSVKFPKLLELAEPLLTSIDWYGSANVEFKIDERDKTPKLMEVNPHLWGSLQLAISSGINIPYLLYQLAMKGDIQPRFEYKTGVKFRWFVYGDFMHFLTNLIVHKKFDFDVFKLYEKNNCHATWLLSDPLPFLGLPLSLLDYLVSDEMKKFRT